MNSEDSEFVVIDDEHYQDTKESIHRLNEVQMMYKSAHDALIQSNFLLQEQLSCALQLVLERLPADFDSNTQELTKRISESLDTASESILRNHVKSLCARLLAVNADRKNLSEQLANANIDAKFDATLRPKLDKLSNALRELDGCFPGGSTEKSLNSGPCGDIDLCASEIADLSSVGQYIDNLCTLAEGLKDRINVKLDVKTKEEAFEVPLNTQFQISQSSQLKPEQQAFTAPPQRPPIQQIHMQQQPVMDANAIACLVREKVATVLQEELQTIREQQADLFKSTLAASNADAASVKKEDANSPKMMDPSASQPPVTLRPPPAAVDAFMAAPIVSPPAYDEQFGSEFVPVPREIPSMNYPLFPPKTLNKIQKNILHSEQYSRRFYNHRNPVEIMPTTRPPVFIDKNRLPPRTDPINAKPSFTSEQENPLCPVCDVGFKDRMALELHLEACHL